MSSSNRASAESGTILASAARGSAFLTVGRLAARAGSFAFFVLLTRLFPARVVGSFASAQAIGLILYAFLDYGLATLLTRDLPLASEGSASPLRAALRARAATAVVSLGVALAAALASSSHMLDVGLVWLAMLLDVSAALMLTGARKDGRLGRIVLVDMLRAWSAPLILGGAWLATRSTSPAGPWTDRLPYLSFVAASAVGFTFAVLLQRAFLRQEWAKPERPNFSYRKEGLVVAASAVAVGIHNRIDLILLKILDTPAAAASYAGAYTFLNAAFILPILYSYTLFPVLARLAADSQALREVLDRGTRTLAMLGSLVGALLAAAPEMLLSVAFGVSYARGGTALVVLAAAIPFVFVSNLSWNTLVSRRRELRVLVYIAVAALFNAAMNVWLIPIYSLVGAAVATLLAEVLVWVWSSRTLSSCGIPTPKVSAAIGTAAAALVPAAVSLILAGTPSVVRATAVLTSWLICVQATRLVRWGELKATLGLGAHTTAS